MLFKMVKLHHQPGNAMENVAGMITICRNPLSPLVQSRFRPRENSCLLTPGHPEVPGWEGPWDGWIRLDSWG